ncbi:hypothetical protein J3R83DRAFT_2481 [Lanmaoa asiatica]|nr:hypothetical protein J3R83DRAFT_2481 [Lanmaoa asiatica]
MSSLHTPSRPDSQVESHGTALNTPAQDAWLSEPPRASYLEQTLEFASDSSRGSIALHSAGNSSPLLSQNEKQFNEVSRSPSHPSPGWTTTPRKRSIVNRPIFWIIASVTFLVVAAAVIIPVYFFVIKSHSSNADSTSGSGSGTGGGGVGGGSGSNPTTGGNGSVITTSDGTTFTYINNFGGICESSYKYFIYTTLSTMLYSKFVITSSNTLLSTVTLTYSQRAGGTKWCINYSSTTCIHIHFSNFHSTNTIRISFRISLHTLKSPSINVLITHSCRGIQSGGSLQ